MARETILVVDDEPMLGFTVKVILEEDYEVVVVDTAQKATELLSGDQRFDLVLCDLQMPVMSGMDLHEWVQHAAPHMRDRLLFMTGGACSSAAEDFLARPTVARIAKPFDSSSLLKKVADRIAEARPFPAVTAHSSTA